MSTPIDSWCSKVKFWLVNLLTLSCILGTRVSFLIIDTHLRDRDRSQDLWDTGERSRFRSQRGPTLLQISSVPSFVMSGQGRRRSGTRWTQTLTAFLKWQAFATNALEQDFSMCVCKRTLESMCVWVCVPVCMSVYVCICVCLYECVLCVPVCINVYICFFPSTMRFQGWSSGRSQAWRQVTLVSEPSKESGLVPLGLLYWFCIQIFF